MALNKQHDRPSIYHMAWCSDQPLSTNFLIWNVQKYNQKPGTPNTTPPSLHKRNVWPLKIAFPPLFPRPTGTTWPHKDWHWLPLSDLHWLPKQNIHFHIFRLINAVNIVRKGVDKIEWQSQKNLIYTFKNLITDLNVSFMAVILSKAIYGFIFNLCILVLDKPFWLLNWGQIKTLLIPMKHISHHVKCIKPRSKWKSKLMQKNLPCQP